MASLHTDAQRTDGAGDEDFTCSRFTRFAGDFYATAIKALDFVAKPQGSEFEAIRAKRICFDNLCACFDVGLVHTENGFGFRGIQLVEAADCAHGFVQQRTHGAVRHENGTLQPFVKILNFHWCLSCALQPR